MKRLITFAAIAALGTAGTAFADGKKGSSAPSAQAPGQLQGGGQYTTHCGEGGWDAPGGGIPAGCSTGPAITSSDNPIGAELPNAQAGQCFARVVIPAVYDNVPKTVTTHDPFSKLSVSEPKFAPDVVNVKVRDEGVRYKIREARYEPQTEQILVKPAYERLTVKPAEFATVSDHIQVGKPRLVWRPGKNLSGVSRTDPHTGAVYCLVEEPGKTVTVQRRVVKTPEQIFAQPVPAQYIAVTKQILVDRGGVDQEIIPAEFRDVPVSRLVNPAQRFEDAVPAQSKTINTRVLRSAERFEWVPVLCDTNATHSSISRIQRSLASAGHYNGRIDGVSGPQTHAAIRAFQAERGLPANGTITADTATALGVGDLVAGARTASADRWTPNFNGTAPQPARAPAAVANAPAYTQTVASPAPAIRQRSGRLNWAGKR